MHKSFKIALYILFVLLFLGGVIGLLGFAQNLHAKRVCNDLQISIQQNDVFVTEDEIAHQLSDAQLHPIGNLIGTLNSYDIEKQLLENSAIQQVHVFTELSGGVNIEVLQRQPIARIENTRQQQFYMGADACLIASNPAHTARLLIVNGHLTEPFRAKQNVVKSANDTVFPTPMLNKIYELATFIRENEFLNDFIEQIFVTQKQEFELVPKVGNHLILLGNAENYQDQFDRLEKFYTYGIKKAGWNAYKIINLKYDNQVVCTRNELTMDNGQLTMDN